MPEVLEIIISATDEASAVLTGIGNKAKGAFSTAMKVGAAGVGVLGTGLAASIVLAFDAETSLAKLESVIESTGGVAGVTSAEAQALADSLALVTKFSDEQIQSAETLLLTFTGIGEDVFPVALETVLNMGEAFGSTDSAAIQLGKALNDPIVGIGALAEVGVSFTEEQKDMVAAMVEAGDVAGAQALILAELETEFGGMARAAGDTAAGKLAIFKNQLIDVAQSIGSVFLPFISRALDAVIDFVAPISGIVTDFGQLIAVVEEFGTASTMVRLWAVGLFGSDVGNRIADVIATFGELRDTLLGFVNDILIPFVQDHLPAFKGALLAVGAVIGGAVVLGGILTLISTIGLLLNPIVLLIAAAALLGAAWAEDWLGIRSATVEVINTIKPMLEGFAGFIKTEFGPALSKMWDGIKEGDSDAIIAGVRDITTKIVLSLMEAGPDIETAFEFYVAAFKSWVPRALSGLIAALGNLLGWVIVWVYGAVSRINDAVLSWSIAFVKWVPGALLDLIAALDWMLLWVNAWIVDVAGPKIAEQLIRWTEEFVLWVTPALVNLIIALGGLLVGVENWIVDRAAPAIIAKLPTWGAAFISWLPQAVLDLLSGLGGLLLDIGIWATLTAVPTLLADMSAVGAAIVDGIEAGVSAGWDAFSGWLSGLLQSVIDDALGIFAILSPSGVFKDIGENIVEGMAIGLSGLAPVLEGGVLAPMAATAAGAQQIGAQTTNNFTQIINTSASTLNAGADFLQMQAFAGS